MVAAQNVRVEKVLAPISATGAYTVTTVDTVAYGQKFDYATIVISIGVIGADMTVCKLTESDDNSTFTDATGFVGAASGGDFVLPTSAGYAGTNVVLQIDLRKRKRYLKMAFTAGGSATLLSCVCVLSRAHVGTNSTADSGVKALVIG